MDCELPLTDQLVASLTETMSLMSWELIKRDDVLLNMNYLFFQALIYRCVHNLDLEIIEVYTKKKIK